MQVIYKYPFQISDIVEIDLPLSAKTLSIQVQNGQIFLWALIEKGEKFNQPKKFYVYGTGNDISFLSSLRKYISTIQYNGFVWHIFE